MNTNSPQLFVFVFVRIHLKTIAMFAIIDDFVKHMIVQWTFEQRNVDNVRGLKKN